MVNFAINPVFQIAKRTGPMIAAAVIACIADPIMIYFLPQSASSLAIAQSGATLVGMVALILFAMATGAHWPRARDILLSIAATGSMIACVLPMRSFPPGVLTLLLQVVTGILIYGLFVAWFDIAGLRLVAMDLVDKIRSRLTARRPAL